MSQRINLNTTPNQFMPILYFSQGDIGRTFEIALTSSDGYSIPIGATVEMVATKPSGFGFTVSGSLTGNVATFVTTETMTSEWGRFPAEIVIKNNGDVIGTANFYLNGERNPHPEGTIDGDASTIIPQLTLLVERVETAASSVLDRQTVTQTLPAGSQASYSFDEETNTQTFGIPQGEAGAGAVDVTASAYSSSKTYAVGDYVIHNDYLYRCTTAITTAEAWTSGHWTQVLLGDEVSDVKSDLNAYAVVTLNTIGCGIGQWNSYGERSTATTRMVASYIGVPLKSGDTIISSKSNVRFAVLSSDINGRNLVGTDWIGYGNSFTMQNDGFARIYACYNPYSDLTDDDVVTIGSNIVIRKNYFDEVGFDKVSKLSTTVNENQGGYTHFDASLFVTAGLTNGIITTATTRVATPNIMSFDYPIKITAENGYRFGIHKFDGNDQFVSDSGWQTEYSLPSNQKFKIVIAHATETSTYTFVTVGIEQLLVDKIFVTTKINSKEAIRLSAPWETNMHRGYSSPTVHENTIPAFYRAWLNGANWIEVDARLSSDGIYVSNHDATVTVNGTTYTIANETADTLTHLVLSTDAIYGDCCIPKLETVLTLCCYTGMKANVDCKAINPTTLAKLVVDCGMSGKVMYGNTSAANMPIILGIDPNAGFVFNYDDLELVANTLSDYHTRQRSYAWSTSVTYEKMESVRAYGFKYLLSSQSSTANMPYVPDCIEFVSTANCKDLNETYLASLNLLT